MVIVMRDGRVFQGTPEQIVRAMQDIAFGADGMSLDEYIDWVIENACRFEGVELKADGATPELRASSLIDGMVNRGLALVKHAAW